MQAFRQPDSGFTLIELMLVIAILAIVLATAIPVYRDYTIRTKAAESLLQVTDAKRAVAQTCQSHPDAMVRSNADANYVFIQSMAPDSLVADVRVRADCAVGAMWVGVRTKNSGAAIDPIFLLTTTGMLPVRQDAQPSTGFPLRWDCWGLAESAAHLPAGCRPSEQRFESQIL